MAITNGYATLAEAKSFLATRGLAGSVGMDAADDAVIEDQIEAVSRLIDRTTGRRFYADSADTAYYYTAEDEDEITIPDFKSITTVSVDYGYTRSYTDLSASDWEALPVNYSAESQPITGVGILPTSNAYFVTTRAGIKITGKRGFPAVPDDIKEATLETMLNIYSLRSGQTGLSVSASGISKRPDFIPSTAMEILKTYRPMI